MSRKIPADAFELYVGLGPHRSYQAVADHYGVTKRAITKVAVREGWTERLEKVQREARKESDRKLAEAMGEMHERHLKILKAMSARALTALREYPLSSGMEAMRGAERVIKLERLIMGEPSERTEVTVEEITKQEIRELLVRDDGPDDLEAETG